MLVWEWMIVGFPEKQMNTFLETYHFLNDMDISIYMFLLIQNVIIQKLLICLELLLLMYVQA
jgi:hypothetical protein